ncbi:MAG TPA: prepilin-type N-terminal cleavage/methylation domain-containing protein [Chthoniobacteraceae bacterium]|nr:prepilin-type N-terminal cleavage/methylation domain-containing protein [Chthoniobacteraceae bacterium]
MKRSPHGFSLTELLVTVVVVAVVLGLLLPGLSKTRQSGLESRCVSNLRQLGAALHLYASENRQRLPEAYESPEEGGSSRYWQVYLQYSNPSNTSTRGILPNENRSNRKGIVTVYHCPANPYRVGRWGTPNYALNRAVGGSRLANIPQPHQIILLVDAGIRGDIQQDPSLGPDKWLCYGTDSIGTFEWQRSVNFDVHSGQQGNFLFVDGHVEGIGRSEVARRFDDLTLLWSRENKGIRASDRYRYW